MTVDAADPELIESPPGHDGSGENRVELGPRWWGIPRGDFLLILGMIAVFASLLTYFGQLRVDNFYALNWDLGINQQMLWTTAHGHLLYETGDAEFYGTQSFLAVHSTYVALLVVPIYAVAPFPATLFVLQSLGMGFSAVPLYWIARRSSASRPVIFLAIVIYLGAFGGIAGLLYDFHWEAFLPLEFLTFFYLATERRYLASLVPFAAGVLTLEVFPFLAAAVALYIGVGRLWSLGWHPRQWVRDRDLRIQVGLLIVSALVYVGLRVVQYAVIPTITGQPSAGSHVAGAVTSAFAVGMSWSTLGPSSAYWLLLLASVGFLPLLSPRALILSVPWFVSSFVLMPQAASTFFGNQYALLALAGVAVGLVEGLAWVERDVRSSPGFPWMLTVLAAVAVLFLAVSISDSRQLLSGVPTSLQWPVLLASPIVVLAVYLYRRARPATSRTQRTPHPRRWTGPLTRGRALGAVATCAIVLLSFNVVMSPLNTVNQNATPLPGYQFQYGTNPMAADMGWLTSYIPADAEVLASNNVFPYVANNPNAWAVPWFPVSGDSVPWFPFSNTSLPSYILVDESEWLNLPTFLQSEIWNRATYGLVAVLIGPTYPGSMFLYDRGFSGTTTVRSVVPLPTEMVFDAGNLSLGPGGYYGGGESGSPFHSVKSGAPGTTSGNPVNIWHGPYVTLPPGSYRVTVSFGGSSALAFTQPDASVVWLDSSPAGAGAPQLNSTNVTASFFQHAGPYNKSFEFSISEPYPLVEFRGYVYDYKGAAGAEIVLNYIVVQRLSGP